eukprot:747456-Hanusia_phi.AAC.1
MACLGLVGETSGSDLRPCRALSGCIGICWPRGAESHNGPGRFEGVPKFAVTELHAQLLIG